MAGRAGWLGYNEIGRAILLADSPLKFQQLFLKFSFVNTTMMNFSNKSIFVDKDISNLSSIIK